MENGRHGRRRTWWPALLALAMLLGCPTADDDDDDSGSGDDDDTEDDDSTGDDDSTADDDATPDEDPFADALVSFFPGEYAGFGQEDLPDIVLGPPEGAGEFGGSTHVVSLGQGGEIVLEFVDVPLTDGPGADLLVFENAFVGWLERGFVAASEDGAVWHEWPCDPEDADGGYPGCAGVQPVFASSDNGIDPTDPALAGGDAFDLADLGLVEARFVRVRDSGTNIYGGDSGGFDLDAVAVLHGL